MKLPALILPLLLAACAHAQVMLYRQLPEIPLSQLFKVEIRQGTAAFQPVITYGLPTNDPKTVTKIEHLAPFAFEPNSGPVEIRVLRADGKPVNARSIAYVNRMYPGVTTSFADGALHLRVNQPKKQLLVRLTDNHANPLTLFVDPIRETPIPADANVVRFAASDTAHVQTAEFDRYTVPNDVDVVYLEDGALFKGTIHTAKTRTKPLTLMGRGMVIGNGPILHGPKHIPYNAVVLTSGKGHLIEGIIVAKSRHFSMDIGDHGRIDNVKLLGYNTNNDGIVTGDHAIVENSYLKVNDDHIKLYNDHVIVRNCVFYIQWNGGLFQFAWNKIEPGDHCLVENCEVVECEFTYCGDAAKNEGGLARTILSLREQEAEGRALRNCTIRNMVIQGQLMRFMGFNGLDKPVEVEGLVVENIHVLHPPKQTSWVYTQAPIRKAATFKNVVFGDRAISAKDFATQGDVQLTFDGKAQPFSGKMPELKN